MKGINSREKNGMWKGDEVGYNALHSWVRKYKFKSELCECCHKNKSYDLANISGEYKRNLDDWEWLCRKCHMVRDGRLEKIIEIGRKTPKADKNSLWKGGKPKCLDCNKQLTHYYSKRCMKCEYKRRTIR